MKTSPYSKIGLVAVLTIGLAQHASAGIFSNNIDMLVVAETPNGSPSPQGGPVSYALFDGGYIEAGDPIAGDTAPSADQVSQSLRAALANQGFQAAASSPSVIVTYNWGVLRIDHRQIRVPYGIKSNLEARIELVSTQQLGAEVENHILLREKSGQINPDAASPLVLVGPAENVAEESRQPRIFVIVSAYDYQGLLHREAKLLWRVKLSTREQSGEMDEVIPALIAGGAPYFGRNLENVKTVEVTPGPAPQRSGATGTVATPDSLHLDGQFINSLLKREHDNFSGGTGNFNG
jgi:hypothetical protein